METYRLFVAVEAPPDVKAELAAAQERLRRTDAAVKWVAPEALHMTLHFLGETDVGQELGIDFLNRLPAHVDPCGENGEYHSFVYAGPIFRKPVPIRVGERLKSEGQR